MLARARASASQCHRAFLMFIIVRRCVRLQCPSIGGLHGSGVRFKETGFGGFTEFLSPFPTDSSKELEELRSMFTRALEYLQQEVEERKSALLPCLVLLPSHSPSSGCWLSGHPNCPILFWKVSARVEIRAA